MPSLLDSFAQLLTGLWNIVSVLFWLLVPWLPLGVWCAWWLWGVNWKHAWPVLARGAWAPALLLIYLVALVWSYLAPSSCNCLVFMTIGNFWWQLGAVSALAALALLCGWLQGQLGWTPEEVSFEPPAAGQAHGGAGHH
jgi:hypothetical protein